MMILLDTHAWIWLAADPSRLSKPAVKLIEKTAKSSELSIASISLWETAMLISKERLSVSLPVADWMEMCVEKTRVSVLPLTARIAVLSTQTGIHGDPADRIIAATAWFYGIKLLTADKKLRDCTFIICVWD
jgi:PIN domain nuclease of toxin-antitoxin system